MENLKRYNPQLNGRTGNVDFIELPKGEYVKFTDIEEALHPCQSHSFGQECILDNPVSCGKQECKIDNSNSVIE